MKHTKKLFEFIINRENDALQDWIMSQPELDRAEIIREGMRLLGLIIDAKGFDPKEFKDMELLANSVDIYEDTILDRKLNNALNDMESDESQ